MADVDRDSALSLAFMRGHPAAAARVLEGLPAAAAGALFERVPARVCADVLGAMLPRQAAACIAGLGDARILELLAPLGTQGTVALLRHFPEARRRILIAGLPTGAALASALLLGYTEDTLGAWADPDVVTLPADTTAAAALESLRQAGSPHPLVFVVTAARQLGGVVAWQTLAQAPAAATLATLMRRPPAVLPAHAPLAGAAAHPGWELASALPVIEPGERLVGVMTRDALARALRESAPAARVASAPTTLPSQLAAGYWLALSGLVESALTLLPRVPPVLKDGDAG